MQKEIVVVRAWIPGMYVGSYLLFSVASMAFSPAFESPAGPMSTGPVYDLSIDDHGLTRTNLEGLKHVLYREAPPLPYTFHRK